MVRGRAFGLDLDQGSLRRAGAPPPLTLDRMVRGNESLQRIADVSAVTAPRSHDAADDLAAPEAWADQHAALATLLHQGPQAQQTVGTQTRS